MCDTAIALKPRRISGVMNKSLNDMVTPGRSGGTIIRNGSMNEEHILKVADKVYFSDWILY